MKKVLAIGLPILAIGGAIFAYARRFLGKLTFDVDLELKIVSWKENYVIMPLLIYVDNKNKRSLTVKDLSLRIYDIDNVLLAETYEEINSYEIKGFINNKLRHPFIIYTNEALQRFIEDQIYGRKTDVYLIAKFTILGFIPIQRKEELSI